MGPQLRCKGYEPHQSSLDLDVTAVRLSAPPGEAFGVINVPEELVDPVGSLITMQHPGDLPKQVSISECAMIESPVSGRVPDSDFTHTCDTANGSSGAPILNTEGQLVSIHHFGFNEASDSAWRENRGVLATLIIGWMEEISGLQ